MNGLQVLRSSDSVTHMETVHPTISQLAAYSRVAPCKALKFVAHYMIGIVTADEIVVLLAAEGIVETERFMARAQGNIAAAIARGEGQ